MNLTNNQSNTANGKQAIGAVLGSVTVAAQSIAGIFSTVGNGVGMLNRTVSAAAEKQEIAIDYEMADFEENLHINATLQRAVQKQEINRFLDATPGNRTVFEATYNDLASAVAERRAKRQGLAPVSPLAALRAAAEDQAQRMPNAE